MTRLPASELFFITGADAMLEIMRWKDPATLFDLAHFIAATRPGYDVEPFDGACPTSSVMQIPALAISSTDIRARVHEGRPIRFLVPAGVEAHIRDGGAVPMSDDELPAVARRTLGAGPAKAGAPRRSSSLVLIAVLICWIVVLASAAGTTTPAASPAPPPTSRRRSSRGRRPAGLSVTGAPNALLATVGSGGGRPSAAVVRAAQT